MRVLLTVAEVEGRSSSYCTYALKGWEGDEMKARVRTARGHCINGRYHVRRIDQDMLAFHQRALSASCGFQPVCLGTCAKNKPARPSRTTM